MQLLFPHLYGLYSNPAYSAKSTNHDIVRIDMYRYSHSHVFVIVLSETNLKSSLSTLTQESGYCTHSTTLPHIYVEGSDPNHVGSWRFSHVFFQSIAIFIAIKASRCKTHPDEAADLIRVYIRINTCMIRINTRICSN